MQVWQHRQPVHAFVGQAAILGGAVAVLRQDHCDREHFREQPIAARSYRCAPAGAAASGGRVFPATVLAARGTRKQSRNSVATLHKQCSGWPLVMVDERVHDAVIKDSHAAVFFPFTPRDEVAILLNGQRDKQGGDKI